MFGSNVFIQIVLRLTGIYIEFIWTWNWLFMSRNLNFGNWKLECRLLNSFYKNTETVNNLFWVRNPVSFFHHHTFEQWIFHEIILRSLFRSLFVSFKPKLLCLAVRGRVAPLPSLSKWSEAFSMLFWRILLAW